MTNPFNTEAELCAAFLACVPSTWQAYPESCGFDIVLAHKATGAQVGIEAKLTLNSKVLVQVTEKRDRHATGPDFRAVLVGKDVAENRILAARLGIKVLQVRQKMRWTSKGDVQAGWEITHGDDLPSFRAYRQGQDHDWWDQRGWVDEAPAARLVLPEYVPQVAAGMPAPMKLTPWMIQAIKLCICIERFGAVTKQHFADLKISQSRWTQDGLWLERTSTRGVWKPGPRFPGPTFQAQHPVSWAEIERDWPIWGGKLKPPVLQEDLLLTATKED